MDLTFPQDEEAVVGAILIDPDGVLPPLVEALRGEDFSDPTLRHLFEAARDLFLAKKPVDPVTIGAAAGASEEYGKLASGIMARTPTAANVMEYAEIVRRNAQLRELQSVGWALSQCCNVTEARELMSRAAAASSDRRDTGCRSWQDLAKAFMAELDQPPDEYLELGIPELTKAAKIQAGQYIILGAYNSVGKTALALQIAFSMAASGKRVGFFSLETQDRLLARRIFAQQTGASLSRIQEHRLWDEEIRRSADLVEDSWDYELMFFQAAGFSPADIRARTLSQRLEVVFVDYVQLLASSAENPVQELRSVSMQLHTMAQQLGVTVVALSQVTLPEKSRKTGVRPPLRKENLRESQQLANDADVVLLLDLSDPEDYESNRVLLMDKNKDVGQARLLLAFDGPRLRFSYMPPFRDPRQQAAEDRNRTMDENRSKRRAAEAARQEFVDEQEAAFRELEGGKEGLPF